MNPMDKELDMYLKKSIRRPKQIGDKVFVYNGNDELVKTHLTVELVKAFFSMTNDMFFNLYGFNFVPNGRYWELSKKASRKNVNK